jgi:transposase InsO family protein
VPDSHPGLVFQICACWQPSGTLEIGFVLDAAEKALESASPEIINTDQGSHYTSPKFTSIFLSRNSRISMGHRGRRFGSIFVERLWTAVKHEGIHRLNARRRAGCGSDWADSSISATISGSISRWNA